MFEGKKMLKETWSGYRKTELQWYIFVRQIYQILLSELFLILSLEDYHSYSWIPFGGLWVISWSSDSYLIHDNSRPHQDTLSYLYFLLLSQPLLLCCMSRPASLLMSDEHPHLLVPQLNRLWGMGGRQLLSHLKLVERWG